MKKNILLMAVLITLVSLCLVFASCDNDSSDSGDPAPVHVTGVTLNQTTLEIYVGEDVQLNVTVEPEEAADKTVSWSSSNKNVATVDNNGNVHAVATGETTITVTTNDGGKYAKCTVNVSVDTRTFKAVYNTNGGANTLTFYYDAVDHSGEGTVYENGTANYLFDGSKSYGAKWGYNGNRGSIKSVVIDASVADYKGLTSTTCMFQAMTIATDISGAEHLDVSNVTDMSYMFQNFGGGKSGSPTTLNVVPDVSKWNTGNVTNMSGMFESYGNFSSSLDKVPDVSGWNTGNVANMAYMFQKYGHESTSFNAVPDVSKWNTGNVTNMANMFMEYSHKSTKLDTVPDMSKWKTGNVTDMKQMFNGYGNASTSISCVLDLSGWDLSKITGTNGTNVFKCNPAAFNVKIPAKTDGKSNDTGNWYYGQGGNGDSIIPPTDKTFTPTLAGVFSVSATKKVHFSKGNLWHDGSAFKFETNQYDIQTSWSTSHVSNFYWSKTASVAYANLYIESSPSASDVFFTNATGFTVGGQEDVWRTLSRDEWKYLFEKHKYKYAQVNGKYGIVIAPDGFSGTIADSYSTTAWATAESNGLVFLPNTGFRNNGTSISETDKSCFYWTSTASDVNGDGNSTVAYRMFFQWKNSSLDYNFDNKGERQWAVGIRLVTE